LVQGGELKKNVSSKKDVSETPILIFFKLLLIERMKGFTQKEGGPKK